jgi:flagellar hook-basal body complex protein FliE
MNALGSVYSSLIPQALQRAEALREKMPVAPTGVADVGALPTAAPANGFSSMLEGLVDHVSTKQAAAGALTQRVLLGETDQLHQSVIAMQEASVSFSLMVEVRNKLVESYQELMRLQV